MADGQPVGPSRDAEAPVRITLNGEGYSTRARVVGDLVASLSLEGRFAVERNGELVPRSQFAEVPVHEGDRIEVVRAIGGG